MTYREAIQIIRQLLPESPITITQELEKVGVQPTDLPLNLIVLAQASPKQLLSLLYTYINKEPRLVKAIFYAFLQLLDSPQVLNKLRKLSKEAQP